MKEQTDIRWGKIVNTVDDIRNALGEGFDYIQPDLDFLTGIDSKEWKNLAIAPEVCTSPLPADAHVTLRGFNIYAWTEYLKKALSRGAEAGCKKILWNDGRSRVVPFEGDISAEKEQVLQFLYLLCEISENFGMSVLVEPLGERRTNFLNTMDEVRDLLVLVGKKNVSSALSLREMSAIGISPDDFHKYPSLISHVQMENPMAPEEVRTAPGRNDGFDYSPAIGSLKSIGYRGTITLPENGDSHSLNYCRALWGSAG